MADMPGHPVSTDDSVDSGRLETGRGGPPRTPGWVKAFGIVALVLILAVILQLLLGIRHGPGLHSSYDSVAGLSVPLW